MDMELTRRTLLRYGSASIAGSVMAALDFGNAEQALAVPAAPFQLERTTETRNTCSYCSVSCGLIMYGRADGDKPGIVHIEDDPDHPVNRGTFCPKGAALRHQHADTLCRRPEHRDFGVKAFPVDIEPTSVPVA